MNEEQFQIGDVVIVKPEARDAELYLHSQPAVVTEIEDDGWVIVEWADANTAEEFHPSELRR